MLPKLNNKKMYGFVRKDYESKMAKSLLDVEDHDGFTNKAGAQLVRAYNKYLSEALDFTIHTSVMFMFMKAMYDKKIDNPIIQKYCNAVDNVVLGHAMSNVMRITRSVASQRKLLRGIKNTVKKNPVTPDWNEVLAAQLEQAQKRLDRLKTTIIPVNLYYTPLGVYSKRLEQSGKTIFQDIDEFVGTTGMIFEDDHFTQDYFDHVLYVLHQVPAEEFDQLISDAMQEIDRRLAINNQLKEIKQKEAEDSFEAKLAQCQQEVLALCSRAEKIFVIKRKGYLSRIKNSHRNSVNSVWVVCAIRVKQMYKGYLHYNGNGQWCVTTSPEKAKIFFSAEDAQAIADAFKDKDPNNLAEISEIRIGEYDL